MNAPEIPLETRPRAEEMAISVTVGKDRVIAGMRPVDLMLLERMTLMPWRVPPRFKKQQNLPGYFWVSQTKQLVSYESRLEMTNLKRLDFEERIDFVLPQPFCLHYVLGRKSRKHVPDFLIWRLGRIPLLVNVKPKVFLDKQSNVDAFAACNTLCQHLQLEHRIMSEPDPVYFANFRWLAGFRPQPYLFDEVAEALLRRLETGAMEFRTWIADLAEEGLVRPVAFHLLWIRKVVFDATRLLSASTIVQANHGQ